MSRVFCFVIGFTAMHIAVRAGLQGDYYTTIASIVVLVAFFGYQATVRRH